MSLLRSAWISVKQTFPNGGSGSFYRLRGPLSGTELGALRLTAGLRTLPYRNNRRGAGGRSLGYRRHDVVQCEVDCQTELLPLAAVAVHPGF